MGPKRRQVSIARGHSSRSKLVEVDGLSEAQAEQRLTAALEPRKKDVNGE